VRLVLARARTASAVPLRCWPFCFAPSREIVPFPRHPLAKFWQDFRPKSNRLSRFGGLILIFETCFFETSGSKSMMNMHIIVATEERWRRQAEAAQQEADKLPLGDRRDALVRSAAVANRLPNGSMVVIV
jgi:hypothetical protein